MLSIMLSFTILVSCATTSVYGMKKPNKLHVSKKHKQLKTTSQKGKLSKKEKSDDRLLNKYLRENSTSEVKPAVIVQKGYGKKKKSKRINKLRKNVSNEIQSTLPIDDYLMGILNKKKDNQDFIQRLINLAIHHYGQQHIGKIDKEIVDQFVWQVEQSFKEEQEDQLAQQFIALHVQEKEGLEQPINTLPEEENSFEEEDEFEQENQEKNMFQPTFFEDGLFYVKH